MRRTLHIFTESTPPIENYWRECWYDKDFVEYDINIIDGASIPHESMLFTDTWYKSIQLKSMLSLFEQNKVRNGDVFIFTNAWNYVAVPLSYFKDEYKLDITLIGVWGDSLYNQFSPMWQRFKNAKKTFGRQFEKALFDVYDRNCFLSANELDLFAKKYGNIEDRKSVYITGYPFEYISRAKPAETKRDDLIIFPYNVSNDMHVNVFKGLDSEMPNLGFIYAHKSHGSRTAYRNLLLQGKLMFCSQTAETNPVLLWEGMCSGVVPIVPARLMYYHVFPKYYQYPSLLSKAKNNKYLYLMRQRGQLRDLFNDRLQNYEEMQETLATDASEMTQKYYSNKPFLKMLHDL